MGSLKYLRLFYSQTFHHYCTSNHIIKMKILNVAEKNDAAKNIAGYLSRGTARRREGLSVYNKIYEFQCQVMNQNATMVMTSVSGHLQSYEFSSFYKRWEGCSPLELFQAPVMKICPKDYENIKKTIEREIRSCNWLIIWTDCDREGENIGYEIIDVCTAVKPGIQVYRARFSEITAPSVMRALNTLERPNKNISNAVDVRQELDLRIGAAFTRLQTLRLQQVFPQKLAENLVSYGSCQFPTLGFVVDRYKAIEDFVEQQFWKIKMSHTLEELTVDFLWNRDRLFDKDLVQAILDLCLENPTATVKKVISKPKNKWRPTPLDTIEMEKSASRKLKLSAKTTMQIAEKLYSKGLISYPRTETNIFPKELNLTNLVEQHLGDNTWGFFANRIMEWGGPTPRQGKKSDQAHPPIHPTKHADNLQGDEKRVYEFIVRHFLACCSRDAIGLETVVDVDICDEGFQAKGLMIIERNYLDVYPYEKWNAKEIHIYQEAQQFQPTVLEISEGHTTAPPLLTEADLIALMEKHGIGTDATHAEHITTIQDRQYVALPDGVHFVPGKLGMGLVEGYDRMGLEVSLAKPNLRAELEHDLKLICDGVKNPEAVLREQISKYEAVFRKVLLQIGVIDRAIGDRLEAEPRQNVQMNIMTESTTSPFKCPKCGNPMKFRAKKNSTEIFLGCTGWPNCNNVVWFPMEVKNASVMDESCQRCGPEYKKIKFEFIRHVYGCYTSPHIACLGGCDRNLLDDFNISADRVSQSTGTRQARAPNTVPSQFTNISQARIITSTQINNDNNRNNAVNNGTKTLGSTNNRNDNTRIQSTNNRTDNNRTTQSTFPIRDSGYTTNSNPTRNTFGNNSQSNSPNNFGHVNIPSLNASSNRNNQRTNAEDSEIVCGCSQPAILLTVRKQGPNIGRQFYKCASGACEFFLWFSSNENNSEPSSSTSNNLPNFMNHTNDGAGANITCNCGEPAVKRTVQKDTPNKGRSFYSCPKPPNDRKCNFFKWADESGNVGDTNDEGFGGGGGGGWGGWDGGGGGGGGGRGRGRGRGGNAGGRGDYSDNQNQSNNRKRKRNESTGKRRCGNCGEEGHTKPKCPHK